MAAKKTRKAINFDLDDNSLKIAYPKKSYKQAWSDIKKFMLANGFTHRQYSGYCSIEPMSHAKVNKVIEDMIIALPWLTKCDVVKEIDVTNIVAEYSLKHLLEEKILKKSMELDTKDMSTDIPPEKPKNAPKRSNKARIAEDEKMKRERASESPTRTPRKNKGEHEID
jgi:virulence-associated protein VapD